MHLTRSATLAMTIAAALPVHAQTQVPRIDFTCPVAGLEAVIERDDGTRHRTIWLGTDSHDPDICLSRAPSRSTPDQRLFGRWPVGTQLATQDEASIARGALQAFMHGGALRAQFIMRGATGEQTVQQWSASGTETLVIDSQPIKTVRIHVSYVYGGNGATYWTDLWFAPDYNLFVKSQGSLDRPRTFTWRVVKLQQRPA